MSTLLTEPPIFIVGAGRSGTTLLRSLLSAHPRIAIAPETHFMQRVELEGGGTRSGPADFDAFWSRYTSGTRFKDLSIEADRCRELIEQGGDRTFRGVFVAVLAAYRERMGKARVGEKTPGHVFHLPRLLEWFPDACVIVVQRDPRAVIASQLRTPWNMAELAPLSLRQGVFVRKRLHDAAVRARRWSTIYEQLVPAWEADARVLMVRYEALVQNAECEVRKICDFLQEPFDPAMVTNRTASTVHVPDTATRDVPEQWRKEHFGATLDSVSTASLEKWKQQLSPTEVTMIEGRCIRGMRRAEYEPSRSTAIRSLGRAVAGMLLAAGRAEESARSAGIGALTPARSLLRSARGGVARRFYLALSPFPFRLGEPSMVVADRTAGEQDMPHLREQTAGNRRERSPRSAPEGSALLTGLRKRFGRSPTQFCLITGSPRSGTTAMYKWLREHPQVAALTESRILVAAHAFVEQARRFKRLDRHPGKLAERLRHVVYGHYRERQDVRGRALLVDKEPLEPIALPDRQYGAFLESVRFMIPQAKFLLMIRDPLATVWSMRERKWGYSLAGAEPRAFSLEEHIQNWCDCAELVLHCADDPGAYVCSFERLVKNPEDTSRQICEFLELPPAEPFEPTEVKEVGFTEQERSQILQLTRPHVDALGKRGIWHPEASI